MGFDADDDDDDDIGYFDGCLNGFGGDIDGEIAPSFILIHLSLNPSSFLSFDGIIDGVDVLEVEIDDDDDVEDEDDGFDVFPSFRDDKLSSSLLYLLLLLNLILF